MGAEVRRVVVYGTFKRGFPLHDIGLTGATLSLHRMLLLEQKRFARPSSALSRRETA